MVQWFNGTHLVRVIADDKRRLGIRIECAPADAEGCQVSEWAPFVASQEHYYKDVAEVLAEGMRHMV